MNKQIWSSLTVTILTTTLGTATSGYAQEIQAVDQASEATPPAAQVQQTPVTTTLASDSLNVQPTDVVKVGELQSRSTPRTQRDVIAKIYAYESGGRQAVTLYVRSIPVLTFLGSGSVTADGTKMGEATSASLPQDNTLATAQGADLQKTASRAQVSEDTASTRQTTTTSDARKQENDPVGRATAVAARINQLSQENVNAEAIAVRRKPECNCYSITVNNKELVQINGNTILADTTHNLAEDALQATNRLRRLIGNATPLREVAGMPPAPRKVTRVAIGPVRLRLSGMASWYGPGFHGNRSASGEVYNQNAMTAAHRSLPFGTRVQVTNLDNGRSVVVRINDRGPFVGGRVIDLSAAAASLLGMMHSGTAPVQLQVLDNSQRLVTENY
ncbi:MAG: septal ring lytic transglycosylase RlpA family protein [Coleofasciculus sp. Co-bin14]|nr:septal ring lytic transglycosylase RlpA family protein [Coleofasciculus sp. Co-bin14]